MDNKINLSQLAELLSEAGGMTKTASEQFVKSFFDIIAQRVLEEGLVKVKGFGTFKLLDMEDRESVNVNTGERFTIEGHQKISFVPDADLKERINKPFAAFETVEITQEQADELDKMDTETDNESTDNNNQLITPKTGNMEDLKNEMLNDELEKNVGETNVEREEKEVFSNESFLDDEEPQTSEKSGSRTWLKILIWVLAGILVLALAAYLLWPLIGGKMLGRADEKIAEKAAVTAPAPEAAKPAATAPAQTSAPAKTETKFALTKEDEAKSLPAFSMADTVNYKIVGTKATYTMVKGDMLTTIALKYYGTKKVWPYIAKYNGLNVRSAKKLPVGTKIKVPELANK